MIRTTILGVIAAVALSGCGVISIEGRTPPLTTAMAKQLAEQHYNSCGDAASIGQCATLVAAKIDCYSSQCYHVSVAPPFVGWVRIARVPQPSTSSMAAVEKQVPVLTAASARRCFSAFGGAAMSVGDEAAGCDWLWAPATVTIGRIQQTDDNATLTSTVRFAPNQAILAYLAANGATAGDTTAPQKLERAQGQQITLHLTFGGNGAKHWRVGNPENAHMGGLVLGVVAFVALLAIGGLMRLTGGGKDEYQIPAGPAPSIGFAGGASAGKGEGD